MRVEREITKSQTYISSHSKQRRAKQQVKSKNLLIRGILLVQNLSIWFNNLINIRKYYILYSKECMCIKLYKYARHLVAASNM